MNYNVVVLPGDGIGPEVTAEAIKVLKATGIDFAFETALIGGVAIDDGGNPLPPQTLDLCKKADAILLGAVGGPRWDQIDPPNMRPEMGALLPLRSELGLYANLRPAKTLRPLLHASPLKGDHGLVDLVVVRELTGGIYFGQPRGRAENEAKAFDTCVYSTPEVERISEMAFSIARGRRREIVSVDKANVLETRRLWREVVTKMASKNPDVKVTHMFVNNCAMQLVRDPGQFDVILTENLFGDILSPVASMITGSMGLLPSASLGREVEGKFFGLYEPVHGSAPDIAGQGKANPIAAILSAAMMLRYTFGDETNAVRMGSAVEEVLGSGMRTVDIFESGTKLVSTAEMGDAVANRLRD